MPLTSSFSPSCTQMLAVNACIFTVAGRKKKLFLTVQRLFRKFSFITCVGASSLSFILIRSRCTSLLFSFLFLSYYLLSPSLFFSLSLRVTRNQSDHFVTMLIRKPQSLYSVHGRLSAIATAMALHFYCLYVWCSAFFASFPFHSKTTSNHTSNENIYFHLFFGGFSTSPYLYNEGMCCLSFRYCLRAVWF